MNPLDFPISQISGDGLIDTSIVTWNHVAAIIAIATAIAAGVTGLWTGIFMWAVKAIMTRTIQSIEQDFSGFTERMTREMAKLTAHVHELNARIQKMEVDAASHNARMERYIDRWELGDTIRSVYARIDTVHDKLESRIHQQTYHDRSEFPRRRPKELEGKEPESDILHKKPV